jgi:AAA domain
MPFDDPACFRLDRIPVRPIRWRRRPYLACGKLALLDGDPGTGKSLLTADLAARLTSGGRMPDGTWRRKANVLFLNAKDALDGEAAPGRGAGGGVLRPDAGAGKAAPRRRRPARAEGRPRFLAMVRFDLAAQRRTTPMRVRPTDPRRAPCRPYGLGWRRLSQALTQRRKEGRRESDIVDTLLKPIYIVSFSSL